MGPVVGRLAKSTFPPVVAGMFSNFSFIEQNTVQENFVSEKNNKINTTVYNPDNGWRTFIEYKYINKDSIQVKYTGDIERKSFLRRKEIK